MILDINLENNKRQAIGFILIRLAKGISFWSNFQTSYFISKMLQSLSTVNFSKFSTFLKLLKYKTESTQWTTKRKHKVYRIIEAERDRERQRERDEFPRYFTHMQGKHKKYLKQN